MPTLRLLGEPENQRGSYPRTGSAPPTHQPCPMAVLLPPLPLRPCGSCSPTATPLASIPHIHAALHHQLANPNQGVSIWLLDPELCAKAPEPEDEGKQGLSPPRFLPRGWEAGFASPGGCFHKHRQGSDTASSKGTQCPPAQDGRLEDDA